MTLKTLRNREDDLDRQAGEGSRSLSSGTGVGCLDLPATAKQRKYLTTWERDYESRRFDSEKKKIRVQPESGVD